MSNRCNLALAALLLAPALTAGGDTVILENAAKGEWTAKLVPLVQLFHSYPLPAHGLWLQPKDGEAFDLIPGDRTRFPIKAGDSFQVGMNWPVPYGKSLICCLELTDSAGQTVLIGINAWSKYLEPKASVESKAAPTIAIYPAVLLGKEQKLFKTDKDEQVLSILVDQLPTAPPTSARTGTGESQAKT